MIILLPGEIQSDWETSIKDANAEIDTGSPTVLIFSGVAA
jgi:hypothetical protein